jgi:rod shape-determining protein MreB and related proteins
MRLNWMGGLTSTDLGIDLGTANTLIYLKGRGVILSEPSVVALKKGTLHVLKAGKEAKAMLGRTPGSIMAVRPLQDGVIADFDCAQQMIRAFIAKAYSRKRWSRPRVIVAVPLGITQVEKRAIRDSVDQAGAREVYLIEEPLAAAMGAGLPVQDPVGSLVVDLGGGTTEIAVISLAGIVHSRSIRIAGNEMDEAIVQYLKRKYNLLVGDCTAEIVKIRIGSAFPIEPPLQMEVTGRDLVNGIPATATLSDGEIREALAEPVRAIVEAVKTTLEGTPPELAADLADHGIVLTGGGALLRGLDTLIALETHVKVRVAEDPLTCVVLGTGKVLDELDLLKAVCLDG